MDKFQFAKLVSFVSAYSEKVMGETNIRELERLTTVVQSVNLTPFMNALAGDNGITTIKEYRALTNEGLKEAKEAVERVTGPIANNRENFNAIKLALDTEENGQALVEVARNAHKAEQKLAALQRTVDSHNNLNDIGHLGMEIKRLMKEGA